LWILVGPGKTDSLSCVLLGPTKIHSLRVGSKCNFIQIILPYLLVCSMFFLVFLLCRLHFMFDMLFTTADVVKYLVASVSLISSVRCFARSEHNILLFILMFYGFRFLS
jgi:hypothetical protein